MNKPMPMRRPCVFVACDRWNYSRGLCRGHYRQKLLGRTLKPLLSMDGPLEIRVSPATRAALAQLATLLGEGVSMLAGRILDEMVRRSHA